MYSIVMSSIYFLLTYYLHTLFCLILIFSLTSYHSICSLLFFTLYISESSIFFFFFSSRRRHTRCLSDWSSDVCSSDLASASSNDHLMPRMPVIIIGGGPVGMVLALQLDQLGVRCTIINKERDSRWHPKGSTHNSRTMEHYRRLGLAKQIRTFGLPPEHPTDVGYFTTLAGIEVARLCMPSEAE